MAETTHPGLGTQGDTGMSLCRALRTCSLLGYGGAWPDGGMSTQGPEELREPCPELPQVVSGSSVSKGSFWGTTAGSQVTKCCWSRAGRAAGTPQLNSLLTQRSLLTRPHSHGGKLEQMQTARPGSQHSPSHRQEFPARLGKPPGSRRGAGKGCLPRWGSARAPQPGFPAAGSPRQQSLTPL